MDAGIYSAVSGSLAAQIRLDAIANNLANVSTPGFKAERFVLRADRAGVTTAAQGVSTPIARGRGETDFSQGPIELTGNALDVALSGDGFLVVETPRGERLTRRGALGLDPEGFLSTTDGMRVQGESGAIHVPGGPVRIGADGSVLARDVVVGKLRLVRVADQSALVREGGTLFAAGTQSLEPASPADLTIVPEAIEGANTTPSESMVALIDVMRGFEAYMHAAERLDQATARSINDVGRV